MSRSFILTSACLVCGMSLLGGCQSSRSASQKDWAIVIHGGAGAISRDAPQERRLAYETSLRAVLQSGADSLNSGASALDVVEEILRLLEDDPLFNAGRGAVFTADGTHELDADRKSVV